MKKPGKFEWTSEAQAAFDKLKQVLEVGHGSSGVVVKHHDPTTGKGADGRVAVLAEWVGEPRGAAAERRSHR